MLTNHPKKIDKYAIDSILGHGAMGVVYKGYDKEIDRHVAIKVLHPHLLSGDMGDELEQRFKHEVKAAAKCLHQNIVTIFGCGTCNGSPYMVMEYVQGIDLGELLKSGQKFSLAQTIGMTCNVLDALYAAHEMGIVHRDIKPANILLLDTGIVKVTDFGVARIDNSDLTQIGDVIGTPSYMSPEAKSGAIVDNRSDLYSTALVIFELLTLRRLRLTQINTDTLSESLNQLELSNLQKEKLITVFNKALESKPEQRYQTALQLSKALTEILDVSIDTYQQADTLAETVIQLRHSIKPTLDTNNFSQLTPSNLSQYHSSDLSIVEKSLTKYIGPIATVLVKKQAKKNTSMDQLLSSLSKHIPSIKEQENFILSLEASGISKNSNIETKSQTQDSQPSSNNTQKLFLSEQDIDKLTKELIVYLGPIAKRMIKSALKKASTLEELNAILAEKIPDPKQRQHFLDKK
mgnify:CR=1 FL=1